MAVNRYEKEHFARLRKLAPECTVLLKKNGAFPLSAAGPVALYGSGARLTVKGGTGSGDVNSRFFATVEWGLEKAGFTITSKNWLDGYDAVREEAHKQFIADIKRKAKESHQMAILAGMGAVMPEPAYELPIDAAGDTAVYVLARNSGEGNDRRPEAGDIRLTETEIRDILACSRKYERFMLVLNVGGVVDLSPVAEVENILILSQLGAVTGRVLADILLGESVPSGKLAATWSAWEDYAAIGEFGGPDETRYKEGIYVGYRYFDSVGKKPMFPFGYGVTYTDFELGSAAATIEGTEVTVSVPVRNTGGYQGKEVVQVYVSVPWGKLDQPYQTLAGFAKTGLLEPGKSETVTVHFRMENLAGYDTETARYILEAGDYVVRVGTSSCETRACTVVRLYETVPVRQLTNVGGKPDFEDWKPERPVGEPTWTVVSESTEPNMSVTGEIDGSVAEGDRASENGSIKESTATAECGGTEVYREFDGDSVATVNNAEKTEGMTRAGRLSGLAVLHLNAAAFSSLTWPEPYEASEEARRKAASLTDEQLISLCMGSFGEGLQGIAGVIGSASASVAGAAGETTDKVDGMPNLIMADGPAGLRLAKHYVRDKKGAHAIGNAMPAGMEEFMGSGLKAVMKLMSRPPKGEVQDQYCTAIPIGTALAQSWNLELCEACGDLVGEEMERFGIDLWLAPAFNIQRSPLCGRNFEYCSEDPLISGLVGAAVTKGVQKHPGKGTTVKHFCCNNQETNRYVSNSQVSERALREIYLRGFAICIAESSPAALMTSYNLLNGTHTSERGDLMKTVLRGEWGYGGLIMTDWVISMMGAKGRYCMAKPAPTLAAGNDLFMPGSGGDYRQALAALKGKDKEFRLTREEAEYCAAHVIDAAWRMKK